MHLTEPHFSQKIFIDSMIKSILKNQLSVSQLFIIHKMITAATAIKRVYEPEIVKLLHIIIRFFTGICRRCRWFVGNSCSNCWGRYCRSGGGFRMKRCRRSVKFCVFSTVPNLFHLLLISLICLIILIRKMLTLSAQAAVCCGACTVSLSWLVRSSRAPLWLSRWIPGHLW